MIRRLLIANRGEIALRVIRACREMGIESVAIYSDADRRSPHVGAADRSVHIGPAPATDSYLSISRIVDAAAASGADAIHPGYGFLSENAAFAAACERAGIVFVGPPSAVIAQMGSKVAARKLMQNAGVPVVPGDTPYDQTDESIAAVVARVGFPALVKASAGGGGKGMKRIEDPSQSLEAIQSARREAQAAFGDGTLYVECAIDKPRHVEVQVFADNHDHVVHLFERECSVQRRHQKVIEESPSCVVTPRLRSRMTDAAVQAARACGYRNAGTVEFLVDVSGGRGTERFYFLEMNTRLQVEHPVTEQVTGLDMVRAQLLVASGEPLPWLSPSITQRGHAIEARIYAEDPSHGFLPQAGRLLLYRGPRMPGVRIDAGVEEGGEVSVHYDPLLAKVIATATTRDEAIARLSCALREFPILGVRTNIPFVLRILDHPKFRAGDVDTRFLDTEGASLAQDPDGEIPDVVREAIAVHRDSLESPSGSLNGEPQTANREFRDPWDHLRSWRS
ncbi:MAG TPA: biotin carboxylase N-terminal domain-containing protein [Vicinamibacterales bacterium]|nr:biotin carboxylase N-terminal domain-containing protein [Vicinamibacterales bacterium]